VDEDEDDDSKALGQNAAKTSRPSTLAPSTVNAAI